MGTTTPTFAGAPAGVTFDEPTTQAPVNAPVQQAQTFAGAPAGVTFDAPSSNQSVPATQDQSAPQSTSQIAPTGTISATPGSMPNDPMAAKVALWSQNVQSDLKNGTAITPVGKFLKALGAHGFDVGNSPEVGEFMGSLPLGLLKAIQGRAEMVQPGQRWQGVKDTTGGLLDAATIPSAFVAPEAGELAGNGINKAGEIAADAAGAVTGKVGDAVNAIKKPFSLKSVQEALENSTEATQQALQTKLQGIQGDFHDSVRGLLDDVASEAGVKPKDAESLNDVAANVSDAIKQKASGIYKQLDQAIGGSRFQNWDDQIANVKRTLRNSAGIDPDADGKLIERINTLEDAKAKGLEQAKANGVDPDLIHEANSTHQQAMAMGDLSKHIQASMSGLRSDLAEGVNAAPESLSPAKLASRANRLYNTGRLQQALGEDRADDLLKTIESTKQSAKDAASNAVKQTESAAAKAEQQMNAVKTRRKVAGGAAALVGVPKALDYLKHFIGE